MINVFKRLLCKQHKFKKYEVLSNNFSCIGYSYSPCVNCGKSWGSLSEKKQNESIYIDSGIDINASGGM